LERDEGWKGKREEAPLVFPPFVFDEMGGDKKGFQPGCTGKRIHERQSIRLRNAARRRMGIPDSSLPKTTASFRNDSLGGDISAGLRISKDSISVRSRCLARLGGFKGMEGEERRTPLNPPMEWREIRMKISAKVVHISVIVWKE
jgi:hypothetical protein